MSEDLREFELFDDNGRLSLRFLKMPKAKPLVVDFLSGSMQYRKRSNATKNQLISRAVGFKKVPLKVVDTTLGLGTDAFMLASLGCEIVGIERSELIFQLTADGFRRSGHHSVHLINGDSRLLLPSVVTEHQPDVVYIDPMFPKSKKTALASKEMQALQALLSAESGDEEALVQLALELPVPRVVVKRPLKAQPLVREPNNRLEGTTIRFDVYLRPQIPR